MNHNVLFISHEPHAVHLAFAKSVGARVHITPLKKIVWLMKVFPPLGHFYFLISIFYSIAIKVNESVLLVDGGSSIYVAVALKLRHRNICIVHLDGDTMFYSLHHAKNYQKKFAHLFLRHIDAVISVSKHNQQFVYLDVPKAVCPPYPKSVYEVDIMRNPFGLYIGRLDPDKHILETITFALQCPYLERFVVVGDGVLRKKVEELANVHDKLLYEEYQSDVSRYYHECKFLIHLPLHDPHPTTTMEAALCGCFPILSSGVGTQYLFDDIFIVQDSNNFDELNKRIKYILENETAAKELLEKSIKKIPTRNTAIANFKQSFNAILSELSV